VASGEVEESVEFRPSGYVFPANCSKTRAVLSSFLICQKNEQNRFLELRPSEYIQGSVFRRWLTPPSRPEIPTKVLVGKQGHFWLAERRRWNEGLELEIEDFFVFMEEVNQRVEE
jgi:hypothetical protein